MTAASQKTQSNQSHQNHNPATHFGSAAEPALSTRNLAKHFGGVHAVDHLSLHFKSGQITGLIGPNGSGKSTLINALTGIHPIDGGSVLVAGRAHLPRIMPHEIASYGITRTFQEVRLFEQMPVLDNVLVTLTERTVAASLFERHGDFHLAKAEAALKRMGIWEKRHELAHNLSYGQRKLLEIARVLAMLESPTGSADIIFFDEPFAGLFPEMVKLVAGVLGELKMAGKAVILVEHNMDLIRELSDHVYVLDAGKLLAEGDPHTVLSRRDVVEAYLGE